MRAATTRAATTRAATTPAATPRVAGERARQPDLTLVAPTRSGAPRAPFVVLVGTLLVGGLAGLLFLHTALAEDSFQMQDLRNRSAALAAREQALEQQVALEASPKRLAARAESLGMVRSINPGFIRLSDGKVLGKPKPGLAPPPPPVATPAATAAPDAQPANAAEKTGKKAAREKKQAARAKKKKKKAARGAASTGAAR